MHADVQGVICSHRNRRSTPLHRLPKPLAQVFGMHCVFGILDSEYFLGMANLIFYVFGIWCHSSLLHRLPKPFAQVYGMHCVFGIWDGE